jgi:pimeloyl-ACP methyl ester carboxylesterase
MKPIVLAVLMLVCASFPGAAQDDTWLLTERLEISSPDFGFHLPYPSGWETDAAQHVTVIYEQPDDLEAALAGTGALEGYGIRFEYFTAREAQELGLPENGAALQDWLEINRQRRGYREPIDVSEAIFLSWPVLRVRTMDRAGNAVDSVQGFIGNLSFVLTLAAPSTATLDAFQPTWDSILAASRLFKGIVNLGGYSLYLECMGEGSPTVILEQGANAGYDYLGHLQEQVSGFTRVCVHEREKPQFGQRTARDFAEDLHQLLRTARIDTPYVFAAHSFGGYVARLYADEYPDDVVGMVLIDSAHEDQLFELQRIFSPEYYHTIITEIRAIPTVDFEASAAQASAIGRLGDMPLVVLTAPQVEVTAELNSLLWTQTWIERLQHDLARLSTNGTQIIVSGTDHFSIVRNQATVDAIQQVVEAARAR